MRTHDSILLEKAYLEIRTLEEAKFRDIAAAAALGLHSLTGSPANATPVNTTQEVEPQETNYHKAKVALDKARATRNPDEQTLKDIALDQDASQRYAEHLVLQGLNVPDIIRKASKGRAEEMEKALHGKALN